MLECEPKSTATHRHTPQQYFEVGGGGGFGPGGHRRRQKPKGKKEQQLLLLSGITMLETFTAGEGGDSQFHNFNP